MELDDFDAHKKTKSILGGIMINLKNKLLCSALFAVVALTPFAVNAKTSVADTNNAGELIAAHHGHHGHHHHGHHGHHGHHRHYHHHHHHGYGYGNVYFGYGPYYNGYYYDSYYYGGFYYPHTRIFIS